MSQNGILIAKLLVTVTWFAAAAGFLLPPSSGFGQLGRMLFFLLLAVHAVECAVFYPTLKRTGRPLGLELARTLFYGVAHYAEAKALADTRGRGDSGPAPTAQE
jgi:uncharacterized protein YhhL (DUF1145 family)